jgi:hypothetical protein
MAGRVKRLIDELMELRGAEDETVAHFMRAHLMLNGIDPSHYNESSPDDQHKVRQLEEMINDFSQRRAAT